MSLVHSEMLTVLYNEVKNHDIEYKADAFWQAYLVGEFSQDEGYTVSCQWAPNDNTRDRVDAAVRKLEGPRGYKFMATLLFKETKRQGEHPKHAEDQIKSAAKKYFESSRGRYVYGMTGWGTKARCWYIEKKQSGDHKMTPMFGRDERGYKEGYIDANNEVAIYITASINYMKGLTPMLPGQYVAASYAQLQQAAQRA